MIPPGALLMTLEQCFKFLDHFYNWYENVYMFICFICFICMFIILVYFIEFVIM
jgi:hypothetical protein